VVATPVDDADAAAAAVAADVAAVAIHAYLRVVPAGACYAEMALGRVVTAPAARGTGLGRELVRRAVDRYGAVTLRLAAQAHLEAFYAGFGFRPVGAPFVEDGIPHVYMLR
jgi:ElaA protein